MMFFMAFDQLIKTSKKRQKKELFTVSSKNMTLSKKLKKLFLNYYDEKHISATHVLSIS